MNKHAHAPTSSTVLAAAGRVAARRGWAARLLAMLGVLAFVCVAWSVPASAATTHTLLGSFGAGALGDVRGLGADEATGDVYVLDDATATIDKFNSAGEPAEFSALHADSIGEVSGLELAVDNSSGPARGDIYVATGTGAARIYGSDGTYLGELGAAGAAVQGIAVDPAGNVYTNSNFGLGYSPVDKYVPTANPVTEANLASSFLLPTEYGGVLAVDSVGTVYVGLVPGEPQANVRSYDALQFGSPAPIGVPLALFSAATGVDPSDDHLYITQSGRQAEEHAGGTQIAEFDATGEQVGEPFAVGAISNSFAITIDGARGKVFVANTGTGEVDVYTTPLTVPDIANVAPSNATEASVTVNGSVNPLGIDATCQLEYGADSSYGTTVPCSPVDVGAGQGSISVHADLSGLPAGTVYHYRFVATNANGVASGRDQTFATLHAPLIDSEKLLTLGSTSAAVEALINPKRAQTSYQFEYGTTSSYGSSAPVPAGTLGLFDNDRVVQWTFSGLQPGTVYHYRVVASNASGTSAGPDQTFKTYPAAGAQSAVDSCPNAQIREEQAASYLPDCRAYELVSPAEKEGASVATQIGLTQAATDGEAIKWLTATSFGDAQGSETPGAEYVSQRSSDGWFTHSINPSQKSLGTISFHASPHYVAFSEDLSHGIFQANTPVLPGYPNVVGDRNLYLRQDVLGETRGSYELLTNSITPLPPRPAVAQAPGVVFAGASADWSHILIESWRNLSPEATGLSLTVPKLYDWHNGTVKLAGILPNGSPAPESIGGDGAGGGPDEGLTDIERHLFQSAISSDGSRVVFGVPTHHWEQDSGVGLEGGDLYMRVAGAETVQLNASERTDCADHNPCNHTPEPAPGAPQPAIFQGATPDQSKVFFLSRGALTDNAPTGTTGAELYEYDVNAPAGRHLTLISVSNTPANDNGYGDFASRLLGSSKDGSYLYFVNYFHPLIAGEHEYQSENSLSGLVYVWHDGVLRLAFQLSGFNPLTYVNYHVTADGRHFVFTDVGQSLAEEAGVGAQTQGHAEVYVYDYDTTKVACASCNVAGLPSHNDALFYEQANGVINEFATMYYSDPVSDDGRYVFFDTRDALLPQDINGEHFDVYEYGTLTGELHLISSGTCACDSLFAEMSRDGRDVFFTTNQQLVHADIDASADMYDARIEGGIASQNAPAAGPCEGDDCQGPAGSAPTLSLPSSSTFSGAGNAAPPTSPPAVKTKKKAKQKLVKAKRKSKPRAHGKRGRKSKGHKARKSTKRASRRAARHQGRA